MWVGFEPPPMPYIEADDGTELFHVDAGRGPTVMFVHGGFMSHRVWDYQVSELADSHRVVAVDLRGHGESGAPYGTYDADLFARDLKTVVDELDLEEVTLVGWSLGATVVTSYLAEYGDAVERAVLLSSGIFASVARDGDDALDFEALLDSHRSNRPDAMMEFVTGLFADDPSEHVARWLWSIGMECPMHVGLEVLRIYDELDHDEVRDALLEVDVPTAVFQGAHDGAARPEDAKYVADEVLADGKFVPFPDSGHLPFLEQRDRFNRELRSFVDRAH